MRHYYLLFSLIINTLSLSAQSVIHIPYVADFHCHSSFKPFRQNTPHSLSQPFTPNLTIDKKDLPLFMKARRYPNCCSQASLEQCKKGSNKVLFLTMYVPEKQMIDFRNIFKLFSNSEKMTNYMSRITGIDKDIMLGYEEEMEKKQSIKYFDELQNEYNYLRKQELSSPKHTFVIARNYKHLKKNLANPNTVIGIISLEGLHCLSNHSTEEDLYVSSDIMNNTSHPVYQKYLETYRKNIKTVKQWGGGQHAPVYATLTHSFWNMIAGQAPIVGKPARALAIKQKQGLDESFTAFGKNVLNMLLSTENGRRILPDIKHLNTKSRKEFYGIWENYCAKGDSFPIIFSHATVNGKKYLKGKSDFESPHKKSDYRGAFNKGSINLYDEDIYYIHKSKGLIGMMLDKKRLLGKRTKHVVHKAEKKATMEDLAKTYIQVWMGQVFYIVEQCQAKSAWDIICIGSDFDGAISSMETFSNASSYPKMAELLYDFLENGSFDKIGLSREKIETLKFGLSSKLLVEKLMYKNVETFLSQHFAPEEKADEIATK